jgi:hypothetical protein
LEGKITINGVESLTAADFLAGNDVTPELVDKDFSVVDDDAGGTVEGGDASDSLANTITFRDPEPGEIPPGIGIFRTHEILMIASNCSIQTSKSITVWTANRTSDSLSNTGIWIEKDTFDFKTGIPAGWFFNTDTAGGSGFQSATLGLCFVSDLTVSSFAGWIAPPGLIDLVSRSAWRVRMKLSTDVSEGVVAPLWSISFNNTLSLWGGEYITIGQDDESGLIGNLRDHFDFVFTPPAALLPSFTGDVDFDSSAFDTEADEFNDFKVIVAHNDNGPGSATRGGTICIEQMIIECTPLAVLCSATNLIYGPPLHDGDLVDTGIGPQEADGDPDTKHFTANNAQRVIFNALTGTKDRDIYGTLPDTEAHYTLPGTGAGASNPNSFLLTLGHQNISITGAGRFFPIEVPDDEMLLKIEVAAYAAGGSPVSDQPDLVLMAAIYPGVQSVMKIYQTSGGDLNGPQPGDGGGQRNAGLPHTLGETDPFTGGETPKYIALWYINNTISAQGGFTVSDDWRRIRADFTLGNAQAYPNVGTSEIVIESLEIHQVDQSVLNLDNALPLIWQ